MGSGYAQNRIGPNPSAITIRIDIEQELGKDSGMNEMSQAIKTKCAEYINQT